MKTCQSALGQKQEFFAINGLRFIAASWVLLFHVNIHFGKLDQLWVIQPLLEQGVIAMTLFFMLSGFVLSYRYSTFEAPDSIHQYIAARFARLYPVYLSMGLISIWSIGSDIHQFHLVNALGEAGGAVFIFIAILFFVFGLQAWLPGLFGIWNFPVSWSLSAEAFFYTLFPTIRPWVRKLGDRTLAAMVAGAAVTIGLISVGLLISYRWDKDTALIFYVLPIFRLPEFLMGGFGYALFVERGLWRKRLFTCGAISAIVLVAGIYWRDLPGFMEWNFFSSISFMAAFVLCLKATAPPALMKCINYLGRISYCIYLAQFVTIPLLLKVNYPTTLGWTWVLAVSSTIFVALFTYHLIEVPFYVKTKTYVEHLSKKLRVFFLQTQT